jgi:HK97 family phage prohead protease
MSTIHKVHGITITRVEGRKGRMLVSAYHNIDFQGDRVMPGAFTKTIAEWEASGDPCPFIWSHAWSDPMAHVGVVTKFTDTPKGLVVDFDITDSTDFAKQVARLLKERRVTQASFAYDVVRERKGEDGANELLELKLIECGPTLSGANPLTELLSRKSVQAMLARETGQVSAARASYVRYGTEGWHDRDVTWAEIEQLIMEPAAPKAQLIGRWDNNAPQQWVDAKVPEEPTTPSVLAHVAGVLNQIARRAQGAGLVDQGAMLLEAARELSGGEADVQAIVDKLTPLVQQLREAGQPISGANLEKVLVELGAAYPKSRTTESDALAELRRRDAEDVARKGVVRAAEREAEARKKDAALFAKMDALSPGAREAAEVERERQRLISVANENSRYVPRP